MAQELGLTVLGFSVWEGCRGGVGCDDCPCESFATFASIQASTALHPEP